MNAPRRPQLPARQHGRGDRHRPLLRARRRHAGSAADAAAACSAPTSRSRTAATRSRRSTTARAGIRICARRSPAPGVDVAVGDFILAINGVELRAPDNIYRLLDGTANRQTVLTVNSAARRCRARGRSRWCRSPTNRRCARARGSRSNRRLVDKLSNGQLAYVYVPNTGQGGYDSFNRYYFAQQDKQGAVIDERYNGGGSAADYIIDVLQRDFDGYFNNVAGDRVPFTSPVGRHLGTEGDDHQRDGRLGRRPDAVHVPLSQDRPARRQAHVGRPRRTPPTRRRSSTAAR